MGDEDEDEEEDLPEVPLESQTLASQMPQSLSNSAPILPERQIVSLD